MKMKNNDYYAEVITTCIKAITLGVFALDFVLIAILLA